MQINDIFHNCPQEQQQSNSKDLGSKCPRSKRPEVGFCECYVVNKRLYKYTVM